MCNDGECGVRNEELRIKGEEQEFGAGSICLRHVGSSCKARTSDIKVQYIDEKNIIYSLRNSLGSDGFCPACSAQEPTAEA
ncbi:hypothetical protein JCM15908A_15800 [Prevotella dentasini JCM 15908]